MIDLYHITLPLLLVLTVLAMLQVEDLFSAIVLASLFSLIMVTLFVSLEAVDVALTEAVVGTGVSTVLFLCCLARTTSHRAVSKNRRGYNFPVWLACLACSGLLVYGGWGMPLLGDPASTVHGYVNPYYLNSTLTDIGIDNVVTAILASYRGYDTMGELAVIFTAGSGVVMLIGRGHGMERVSPADER